MDKNENPSLYPVLCSLLIPPFFPSRLNMHSLTRNLISVPKTLICWCDRKLWNWRTGLDPLSPFLTGSLHQLQVPLTLFFSFRVSLKSCLLSAPQCHPSDPPIPAGSHVCALPAAMLGSGLPINPQVLGAVTPLLTFSSLPMCMLLPAFCIPPPQPRVHTSH